MNTKKLAGAGAICSATAIAALLLGSTTAVAQETAPDSAFGISASGALTIDPLPSVESPDGELDADQLLGIGDVLGRNEDDLALGVLTAEARAGEAETAVTELNLLQLLRADLVRTYCDDADGGLQIVNGSVLGRDLPESPVPGEELDLSPLLKLTLNDQTRHEDGSLTVTGIELTVLPGAGENLDRVLSSEERGAVPALGNLLGVDLDDGSDTVRDLVDGVSGVLPVDVSGSLQTVTIGSATCGESEGDDAGGDDGNDGNDNGNDDGNGDGGDDSGDDGDATPAADNGAIAPAPAPQVLDASLPVTG